MSAQYNVRYGCYVSVSFEDCGDYYQPVVHCPLYAAREIKTPHRYSKQFTIGQMLGDYDLHRFLRSRFGTCQ